MATGWRDYLILCKPRVVLLMLLTMWAGMYLASMETIPWVLWLNATLGVAALSSAAATLNHIIDARIDARMHRTMHRPLASGRLSLSQAGLFAFLLSLLGWGMLYWGVNALTAVLTLLAAVGYSAIYSIYLKRATPQNIVIGGLSGAMPPLLGWSAVTNHLDAQAWLLVLIIFTWTPAHFWALCLYRLKEYQQSGYPMLPLTHGVAYTKLHILFYSLLTIVSSFLPYALGMSGKLYLISTLFLNAGLLFYALKLYFARAGSKVALRTFNYSLVYLAGLFIMILLDHYWLIK